MGLCGVREITSRGSWPPLDLQRHITHCATEELKYDGFRAFAYLARGRCELVSRNGHPFASFSGLASAIGHAYRHIGSAILDGEILCLDAQGRPRFNDLLFRRGEPIFMPFDLPWSEGMDHRAEPLLERKARLRRMLRADRGAPILYADYIRAEGTALFRRVCDLDLEGIVAKHAAGVYTAEREESTWFKIRNRAYSQMVGRAELFERDRHREPVPGWHCCELACAAIGQR